MESRLKFLRMPRIKSDGETYHARTDGIVRRVEASADASVGNRFQEKRVWHPVP
jgi:hypothetical protein